MSIPLVLLGAAVAAIGALRLIGEFLKDAGIGEVPADLEGYRHDECSCGSAWWRVGTDTGGMGAVAVENGVVFAHSGNLVCVACGQDHPGSGGQARPQLTVVE